MIWNIRARFEDGVFKPQNRCPLQEGAEFDLRVEGPVILPPLVSDPTECALIKRRMLERMRSHPLSIDGCLPTRDELHERR